MKDTVIANKYILLEKLGMGKFGIVYKGIHKKTRQNVAIKMEKRDQEITTIKHETTIYNPTSYNRYRSNGAVHGN